MARRQSRFLLLFLLIIAVCSGCATPLPPTYQTDNDARVLNGKVLALAGEGDLLAAATTQGLFLKTQDGPWEELEAPGIRIPDKITCLAISGEEIAVGTDGEGLHLFSGSTWEVRTSRDRELADDSVLSLAYDGNDEGLAGTALWVGTRKGIAARRGREWKVYTPDKEWLVTMTGRSSTAAGTVYLGSGFKLGKRGDDSETFRPPVTAIGVGSNNLVFGNSDSRIAMVAGNTVAVVLLRDKVKVSKLEIREPVIWIGTDSGLIWGGLRGRDLGKPWPTLRGYLLWSGVLFGSRDSRQFEYRWKLLGYNTAEVADLTTSGSDLWVVYRAEANVSGSQNGSKSSQALADRENQTSSVRLFLNLDDYILRRELPAFENYGLSAGIKGKPAALVVSPDRSTVWIGTSKGLWELKQ